MVGTVNSADSGEKYDVFVAWRSAGDVVFPSVDLVSFTTFKTRKSVI